MNQPDMSSMEQEALHLYDRLAPTYFDEFKIPRRRLYDEIAWELTLPYLKRNRPPAYILDAGGGVGRWAVPISKLGFHVTLYDISPEMCKVAQHYVHKERVGNQVDIVQSDHSSINAADDSLDFVVAMGSLQYSSDPSSVLKEWVRVLKPGGGIAVLVDGKFARLSRILLDNGALEALKLADKEKAIYRLDTGEYATLHLFTPLELGAMMEEVGLKVELSAGLIILGHALGHSDLDARLQENYEAFKRIELRYCQDASIAGMGRQILLIARKLP